MAISSGKPNQLKALSRKTVSFQKRQMFTNICCICLCPLLMVIISAGIGTLINYLIKRSQTPENLMYCSNNNSLTSDGWPIWNSSDPRVYGINDTTADGSPPLKSVNFYYFYDTASLLSSTSAPGASLLSAKHSCVFWFGDEYPQNSKIYELNANLNASGKIDSTYIPPPDGGWIAQFTKLLSGSGSFDTTAFSQFLQFQQASWAIVGAKSGLEPALGFLNNVGPISEAQATVLLQNVTHILEPTYSVSSGLLGAVSQRAYINLTDSSKGYSLSNLALVPYFVRNNSLSSDDDLDTLLQEYLDDIIVGLAALNKSILLQPSKDQSAAALEAFYLSADAITAEMPYGGLYLDEFDAENNTIRMIFHYGTDTRIGASSSFPSAGFRLLETVAQIGQASLRAFSTAGNSSLASATITQGLRLFPQIVNTATTFPFGGLIGGILYPFGVSFLLPIFVIMLVKEKEDRIFIMMKMNGVKAWAYYLSHYVTFFILFFFSTLIFIIAGKGSQLDMFTKTSLLVLVILFFLWGNVQIMLAFILATLFSKSRIALVMTFMIVLVGVVISLVLSSLYEKGTQSPYLNIWAPFAFYRALNLMNVAAYTPNDVPYGFDQLKGGSEFQSICTFLFFEIFVYGAIALYMSQVIPTEFGIVRPWHFPITDLLALSSKKKASNASKNAEALAAAQDLDEREDDDVRAERRRVDDGMLDDEEHTIVMRHMKKVYPGRKGLGPKIAVRDVTFAEKAGGIFGLLGPNGAGKTTLISILTGLYEASGGEARLAGFDIKTDTANVYKSIGVCPQFDILWDDLTVSEHLYFYARLKGVIGKSEVEAVENSLKQVSLDALRNRLSKSLSGGERRRLSIAIALVGAPKVVFLDEPTTGLDPEVRRLIWNIIQNARDNKTIILTTHSMEEAEALCYRIGIMAKGSLRCLGNPLRLKELYGTGFKLAFYSKAEDTARACAYVETILPPGWKQIDAFSTNTAYEFPAASHVISDLFQAIEKHKTENGILQWGISQTTLEEVFLRIISDDDANAD